MKKLIITLSVFASVLTTVSAEEIKIDSLTLNKGLYDSPELLVGGVVPGVYVNSPDGNVASALDVVVRGLNSVYSTSEPLWIVDGVELSNPFGQQVDAYWVDKYSPYSFMNRLSQLDFLNLYDIESIQVVKNISLASMYGPKSANGVIIINTRKAASDKLDIDWSSNVGYAGGFRNNHTVSVSQNIRNSSYRVSAFYKDHASSGNNSGSRFGGLRVRYDSQNYKYVWFGLNFNLAVGKQSSASSAAFFGSPSYGIALRNISVPGQLNTVDGWNSDHDDYSNVFRMNGNAFIQVNFLPSLKWRTDFSIDSNNSTRYFWNGLGTELGFRYNRTCAMAVSTLLDSKTTTRLMFDRYFGGTHHLYADAAFEYRTDNCNFDNLAGEGFFTDALREQGFNLKESSFPTYRVKKQQQIFNISGSLKYDYNGFAGVGLSLNSEKNAVYDDSFILYPSAEAFVDIRKCFFPSSTAVSGFRISGGWGKSSFSRYAPWRLIGNYIAMDYAVGKLAEKGIEIDENDPQKNIASSFDVFDRVLSSEYHVGAQLSFLKGRLSLDADYYSKKSNESLTLYCFAAKTDTYVWKSAPRTEIFSDGSEVSNSGVELSLRGKAIQTSKAFLELQLSGAYNINTVNMIGGGLDGCILNNPLGIIVDSSGNNLGCATPKCTAYLGARFGIGHFSVNLAMDGAAGHSICDLNAMLADSVSEISEKYVRKADYLKLSRLEFAYHFPMSNVKWIKGLDVSLAGANLFTLSSYGGLNPTANSYSSISNRSWGYDYGSLPVTPSVILGISAKF